MWEEPTTISLENFNYYVVDKWIRLQGTNMMGDMIIIIYRAIQILCNHYLELSESVDIFGSKNLVPAPIYITYCNRLEL